MTDNEIIKALECCSSHEWSCDEDCPLYHHKSSKYIMASAALDIINRQKAEIKVLRDDNIAFRETISNLVDQINSTKTEVIQVFGHRLDDGFSIRLD